MTLQLRNWICMPSPHIQFKARFIKYVREFEGRWLDMKLQGLQSYHSFITADL